MEDLIVEALANAMSEIEEAVGLALVPEGRWMSLYGFDEKLIARVPNSPNPLDAVDHLRSVWFSVARRLSNNSWD